MTNPGVRRHEFPGLRSSSRSCGLKPCQAGSYRGTLQPTGLKGKLLMPAGSDGVGRDAEAAFERGGCVILKNSGELKQRTVLMRRMNTKALIVVVSSGTLEALKWLGLALMTADHVNKYLLNAAVPSLFAAGRLALPIFAFVLAYNLAQANALARGAYKRVALRLAAVGVASSAPFIALGGLGWGWWPINVMGTLLVATLCAWLLDLGGRWRVALAITVFVVGGSSVEFWWPGVAVCLCAWSYCRRPSWWMLALWVGSVIALHAVNRNFWALAALPLIFAAGHVDVTVPRARYLFYAYYPSHLAIVWLLDR